MKVGQLVALINTCILSKFKVLITIKDKFLPRDNFTVTIRTRAYILFNIQVLIKVNIQYSCQFVVAVSDLFEYNAYITDDGG